MSCRLVIETKTRSRLSNEAESALAKKVADRESRTRTIEQDTKSEGFEYRARREPRERSVVFSVRIDSRNGRNYRKRTLEPSPVLRSPNFLWGVTFFFPD